MTLHSISINKHEQKPQCTHLTHCQQPRQPVWPILTTNSSFIFYLIFASFVTFTCVSWLCSAVLHTVHPQPSVPHYHTFAGYLCNELNKNRHLLSVSIWIQRILLSFVSQLSFWKSRKNKDKHNILHINEVIKNNHTICGYTFHLTKCSTICVINGGFQGVLIRVELSNRILFLTSTHSQLPIIALKNKAEVSYCTIEHYNSWYCQRRWNTNKPNVHKYHTAAHSKQLKWVFSHGCITYNKPHTRNNSIHVEACCCSVTLSHTHSPQWPNAVS